MIWCYRLLFLPILLISLPYYAYRMWRRGGYARDFAHRLGRFPQLPTPTTGTKRIWLQAVSVGEVLAIGPLIKALQADKKIEIVLTTTTSTGYAEASKRYKSSVLAVGIFPLDFWLFSKTAWARIQPTCLILTESELWPEHLHRARAQKIPAYLVNARISDRSFARYQKVSSLAKRILSKFDHIFAASKLDEERLLQIGASREKLSVSGNIKFDVPLPEAITSETKTTRLNSLGFSGESVPPFVLLGASTWPGEEAILLLAQAKLIETGIDCRLLLVPRHAERAQEIITLLEAQSLPWHQRSKSLSPAQSVKIHLADTTGELTQLTQAADLAFIGKSLPPNQGGQTPIEAAGLGMPLIVGPNMNNFRAVTKSLIQAGAARKVANQAELIEAIFQLAQDTRTRQSMHEAGLTWHQQNRGSSQRIASQILKSFFL
jgi:3-deoxy-D-manno-octulosonic-acid transferase